MKYAFLFLVLLSLINFGCQSSNKEDLPSKVSDVFDACTVNSLNVEKCYLQVVGYFIYADAYGGRSSTQTAALTFSNQNSSTETLPAAWYPSSVSVSFSDSDLVAANIRSGVDILGVTGTYNAGATLAGCSTQGQISGSSCLVSNGKYFYTSAYGGRGTACSNIDNGSTNNNCWLTEVGVTIGGSPSSAISCSTQGLQSDVCKAEAGHYYYDSSYGGRSNLCSTGLNANPCWLADASSGSPKIVSSSSNSCTDNQLNSSSCTTQPGRYVYTAEYGGRNVACTNNSTGNCYVTQALKSSLDTNLIADNIAGGRSIFGVSGSFYGNGDWGSAMHRNMDTSQIGFLAEIGTYSADGGRSLPGGYRAVPNISKDDDGLTQSEVQVVDRTGWGTTTCGETGSLSARITDCASEFGTNARWNGAQYGNAGQGSWKLVSRLGAVVTGQGQEVWLDERTGLLWSSLVSININWCKASGHNNSTDVDVPASKKAVDPDGICDNSTYQSTANDPLSACLELEATPATDTSIKASAKGNMASADSVYWRIPTIYDYEIAEYNGLRFVLPDAGVNGTKEEWTGTIASSSTRRAWTYLSSNGVHSARDRSGNYAVRCIGRGGTP